METIDGYRVEISIAGKNVTGDVSEYLSRVVYTDKAEGASDDVMLVFGDSENKWQSSWYPEQGDTLGVKIVGPGGTLDCGLFEIDEIENEGPPDTMTVKGIAAAITKELRTKNSKAFEKQSLRNIAEYFARKHNLTLVGKTSSLQRIVIDRKTQNNQTDIAFLAEIAREYAIIFSVHGDKLVFMDLDELDAQPPVATLQKTDLSKWRFMDKTSEVYGGASVATRNIQANAVRRWQINPTGTPGEKDILVINTPVGSDAQAQAKTQAELQKKQREKVSASLSIPGNPLIVAGTNIQLEGLGRFSGKWSMHTTTHSLSKDAGYLTDIGGYKIA